MRASTVGINLPEDFPARDYDLVHDRVATWWGNKPRDHRHPHWAGGWNAVAYRFAGAADAEETFRASVSAHGTSPAPSERLSQEKAIFAFYGSACSCLDSFIYGLFAMVGLVEPSHFKMDTAMRLRGVRAASLVNELRATFPADALAAAIEADIAAPQRRHEPVWEWRHVLTHRASPSRAFHRGDDEPDAWKGRPHGLSDAPITPDALGAERRLLSKRLERLTEAANDFLDRRAVP